VKILTVVGNRPQFIKLGVTARRLRELGDAAPFTNVVVNTGQHYDQMLSDVFFTELDIAAPDYNLAMGSGHIIDQIGRMLPLVREICEREAPDGMLVYGDTNSTVAGALAAAHLGIPVLHVEGGERLYRRIAMPEETNRVVTDHLAGMCLTSSRKALGYLRREGFGPDRAVFVGDPMYDIFKLTGAMLGGVETKTPADFGLQPGEFGLATIHRAENTDERETCLDILGALDGAAQPVLLPAHPRLAHRLEGWGWAPKNALRLVEPLGYFDFQALLRDCAFAITDSGGVGREAFFAGKPAIVPLDSSAWSEAVEAGLAVMTGRSGARIAAALAALPAPADHTALIEENFGHGDAGARIVDETAAFIDRNAGGESAWHRLGRFTDLPPATDSMSYSHAAFADRAKAAGRVVLDITASLAGAADLAKAASAAGASVDVFLDPRAAAYNFAAADAAGAIRDISGSAPLTVPDAAAVALLEAAGFAARVAGAGDAGDMVAPWRWAAVPVSPFEAAQRLADTRADAALAEARDAMAGAR
jgi:UDP-GlcNAc3NAcA epimerase